MASEVLASANTHTLSISCDRDNLCEKFAQFKNKIILAFPYDAQSIASKLYTAYLIEDTVLTKVNTTLGVSGADKMEMVVDGLKQHLVCCQNPIESIKNIIEILENHSRSGKNIATSIRQAFQLESPSTKQLPPSNSVTQFHATNSSQPSQLTEHTTKLERFSLAKEASEVEAPPELGSQSMSELEEALNNATQSQFQTVWVTSYAKLQLIIAENPIPIAESMLSEKLISESDLSTIKTRTNCADTDRANAVLMSLSPFINLSCISKDEKNNVVIKLISACLQHKKTDANPVELFLSKLKQASN